ncbi:Bug family tripartite tricarboxylate transporter substrate binding protein [Teichococcus aestuarii]|uniref:Bug family tripartite tricarboxylate transporter substrate binding protein n=1 Tax=Teichococcus aestuarii TaxID=568898 RepID=UPI0036211A17
MTVSISRRGLVGGLSGLALPALWARPAQAKWPDRPIRLVVPYTPGGSNDALARPLAEALQGTLGKPVIVENRPGAGSTLGAGFVANSPPDGYTFLLASTSFATSSTYLKTPYDALESFDPVARICLAPMLIVTKPNGFPDMRTLVGAAREGAGRVQYAMAGMGAVGHFTMEAFNAAAGLSMEPVPYSGISPAQADLLAGRVDIMVTTLASISNLVTSNQVPVLAYTSSERMSYAPQIPTVKEATGIDFAVDVWWGVLAPKGTPAPIREELHGAINQIIGTERYTKFLALEGAKPMPQSMAEFGSFVAADIARWRKLAQDARIKAS